jgi:hypothetical protein
LYCYSLASPACYRLVTDEFLTVGPLYKVANSVGPELASAWFQPLNL